MSSGAITLADITSADWSLMLDATAGGGPGSGIGRVVQGIADVDQCIGIILTTPLGSDPLRPTFGCDIWQFVDAPVNTAGPGVVSAVTQAIMQWEPRVTVLSVQSQPVANAARQPGAHLSVTVSWQLNLGTASGPAGVTTVSVASGG